MIDTLKRFWKAHWHQILSILAVAVLVTSFICINCRAATTDETFNWYGYYVSEVNNAEFGVTYTASDPNYPYVYATKSATGKRMPTTEEYLSGFGSALVTNVPILTRSNDLDENGNPRVVTSISNWAYDSYVQYWWDYYIDSGEGNTANMPTDFTFLRRTPLASLAIRALAPSTPSNPPYTGYRAIPVDVSVFFYDAYTREEFTYVAQYDIDASGTLYTEFLNDACQNGTTRFGHDDLLITGITITPSTRYGAINSNISSNCLQVLAYTDQTLLTHPDTGVGMLSIDDSIQRSRELIMSYDLTKAYTDGRNSAMTENLGVTSWLTDAGDAVTSFTLFEVAGTSVTIGTILSVFLGVLTLIFILKLFAGG